MKKILLILISLFMFTCNLYAECDNETLNNWAEKLDIKFQEVKNGEYPYSYLLMLNNPRTDIRVTSKDTYSKGTYNVEYDTEFKNFVVGSEIHFINKTYTFTIYMSDSAETCAGEKMRTITYIAEKYNKYSATTYCEDNPNDEMCATYKDIPEGSEDKLDKIIENHYNEQIEKELLKNAPWYTKLWSITKEYALYVLIPLVVIGGFYSVVIFITKKRSEKA